MSLTERIKQAVEVSPGLTAYRLARILGQYPGTFWHDRLLRMARRGTIAMAVTPRERVIYRFHPAMSKA